MSEQLEGPEFAAFSKAYRRDQGITQRALAIKVKTTPGVIGDLEKGRIRSFRVAREIRALALAATASEV